MQLFQNSSSINNDQNNNNYKDYLNKKTSEYYLSDANINNIHQQSNDICLSYSNFQMRDGVGWTNKGGANIDNDSNFRIKNKITSLNSINNLNPQHILSGPYLHREPPLSINLETSLRPIIQHNTKKSNKNYNINNTGNCNFHPLVNNVKKKLKPRHIIPELSRSDWVRGGITSRELLKDPIFLKKQGYNYNGKYWYK